MQQWSKNSFTLWFLSAFIGALAAFLLPASYHSLHFLQRIGIQAESFRVEKITLLPIIIACLLFALFFFTNSFRRSDSFTHFFTTVHYYSGRKNILGSLVHGLAAFVFLLGKAVLTLEAIVVEWTSSFAIYLGERCKLPHSFVKTLSVCALGSALATLWGFPLLAILFVIEIFYSWTILNTAIGPIIFSAFIASSVSNGLTSSGLFELPHGLDGGIANLFQDTILVNSDIFIFCIPIIIIASSFSIFLNWFLRTTDSSLRHLFQWRKLSLAWESAIKLFLWAFISILIYSQAPEVLGLGTDFLNISFLENLSWASAIALLLLRFILLAFNYVALGTLGLIVPLLSLAVLLGASLFHVLGAFGNISILVYILLSMAALCSASFGVPLTASCFVFYYSGTVYGNNLLLFLVSIVINFSCYFLASYFYPYRLHSIGSHRRGIRINKGMCFNIRTAATVKDAMIDSECISENFSTSHAHSLLLNSRLIKLPVVKERNQLCGMLALTDFLSLPSWKNLEKNSELYNLVTVKELMEPISNALYPDMSLEEALFAMQDEELVPVVKKNTTEVLGVLLKSDLMNLYNREMIEEVKNSKESDYG